MEVRGTDASVEFTVTLKPVGTIDVVVKDGHGQANDAVGVSAAPRGGGPSMGMGAVGEHQGAGRYRIGPLAAGEYVVEIRDGVNPPARVNGSDGFVEVRSSELTALQVTYGGGAGHIAGRVVDSAGAPMENVWVSARPATADTDRYAQLLTFQLHTEEQRCLTNVDGRFAIDGLDEAGLFSIVARHSLGGEARADMVKVGQEVMLRLSAPGSLSGTVLSGAGRPATYFRIVVNNQESGQQLSPEFGPDAQGVWFIDNVASGTVQIQAQSSDGAAVITRRLAPAERLQHLDLFLEPKRSAQN